jgi:mitogen-activated protein kinase 1/3
VNLERVLTSGYLDRHQLTLILDVLGTPTMEDYYGIKSRRARVYIRSLPFKKRIPFAIMFPKTSPQALDLLEKLLIFSPAKRITVEDSLRYPYLEPYHDPEDEPTAPPIPDEGSEGVLHQVRRITTIEVRMGRSRQN